MRKLINVILIMLLVLTSCGINKSNTNINKNKGSYNYVKDNTYYLVLDDGTRYAFGNDTVLNNTAYQDRKNRRQMEELDSLGYFDMFFGFNMGGFGFFDKKTIKDKFEEKDYYPNNFIDYNKDLTILENEYNVKDNKIKLVISTGSITKKDVVKKEIANEDELTNVNKKEVEESNESNESIESIENTIDVDIETDEKIDSIVLGEDELNINETEDNENISIENFEKYTISTSSEVDDNNKLDYLNSIEKNNYYIDEKNGDIYFLSFDNEFIKFSFITYEKELIDDNIYKIKIYDRNNIMYAEKTSDSENLDIYNIVLYSIDDGVKNTIELKNIRNIIYDDINKDKMYLVVNESQNNLYKCDKNGKLELIDTDINNVYGITKNKIYYSKYTNAIYPYSMFLIDNVSTGEWLGEEPDLKNYKLNDDPLSFEIDLNRYIQDRFNYKYKEKFLNDRRKYVDKYIKRIKDEDYEYSIEKICSYDGKDIIDVVDDYVRNVYILDKDNDIVYIETDMSLKSIPIQKKTLGEFVVSDTVIDQYLDNLFNETKMQYLYYIVNNNNVSNIKDLDLFRGYVDKTSQLFYDTKYRQTLKEKEIRKVKVFGNEVFINGVSNELDKEVSYKFSLSKDNVIFPDIINMNDYKKIKFIDYIDEPLYILYNENYGVLKYGIKNIAENVIVDSVTVDNTRSKIAFIEKNESNVNGILHRVDIKDNFTDYIVSNNAFYYNLFFDSMTNDLCFLINFDEKEEYGSFLTINDNNNITFIDDEVMYILKN